MAIPKHVISEIIKNVMVILVFFFAAYIANKHRKIAKKCLIVFAVGLGITGAIFLACATRISTEKMPAIDKKLSEVVESINKHRYSDSMSFMSLLEYGNIDIQKHIFLFERNLLVGKPEAVKDREVLAGKALKELVKSTLGWSALFNKDKSQKLIAKANIKNIAEDANLTTLAKIIKIENLWEEHQESAKKRLEAKNEELKKNRKLKKEIEENKLCLHNEFLKFQFRGLFLIILAGIIEGVLKIFTT